jgi:hypothetical protein
LKLTQEVLAFYKKNENNNKISQYK